MTLGELAKRLRLLAKRTGQLTKRTGQLTKRTGQLAKPTVQLAKRASPLAKTLRTKNAHGSSLSERLSSQPKLLSIRAAPLRLETETSSVETERRVSWSGSECGHLRPLTLLIGKQPIWFHGRGRFFGVACRFRPRRARRLPGGAPHAGRFIGAQGCAICLVSSPDERRTHGTRVAVPQVMRSFASLLVLTLAGFSVACAAPRARGIPIGTPAPARPPDCRISYTRIAPAEAQPEWRQVGAVCVPAGHYWPGEAENALGEKACALGGEMVTPSGLCSRNGTEFGVYVRR